MHTGGPRVRRPCPRRGGSKRVRAPSCVHNSEVRSPKQQKAKQNRASTSNERLAGLTALPPSKRHRCRLHEALPLRWKRDERCQRHGEQPHLVVDRFVSCERRLRRPSSSPSHLPHGCRGHRPPPSTDDMPQSHDKTHSDLQSPKNHKSPCRRKRGALNNSGFQGGRLGLHQRAAFGATAVLRAA